MARDNQDRAVRVTHHVFGYAADKCVLQPCAAVSGNDNQDGDPGAPAEAQISSTAGPG